MKNEKQQPEAQQFTFDQKDRVYNWAREKASGYNQSLLPRFGPDNAPILSIRRENEPVIDIHIDDWIVVMETGLLPVNPVEYEEMINSLFKKFSGLNTY